MSSVEHGDRKRRVRVVKRPVIPDGPLRDLNDFLYELYLESGPMTLDAIAAAIAANDDLAGSPSRDTVSRCLGSTELPANQHDAAAVAFVLADPARMVPGDAQRHAAELWVRARMAQVVLRPADRAAYMEAVARRYRVLDLAALTPEALDEHIPVLLKQVFVPQLVRPDPPPIELPRELWSRLIESGDLDTADLISDRPQDVEGSEDEIDLREWIARARRARAEYLAKPPRQIFELLTDAQQRAMVILGDPGSGKSSLLRYIAVSLASPSVSLPDGLAPWVGWLPVLVELREYAGHAWRTGRWAHGTLLAYIDYLHAHGGAGLPENVMDALLRHEPNVVVMFDGLDELFSPIERGEVARQIAGFAVQYSRSRIVLTSRPVGDRRWNFDTAGFTIHMLQDLDREQITQFSQLWFTTACHGDLVEARTLTERLLDALDRSAPVRELAGNPLLLTILAIIGRRRALPRERHRVFSHAVDVLVQHWDVNRAIREPGVDMDFIDEKDKRELLRRVARRIQGGSGGIAANHIHGDDLVDEFRQYFDEEYAGLPAGRSKLIAKAMFRQFNERNFILSRFGPGMYGFVHRAFLEYCCADEIVFRFEKTQQLTVGELAAEIFGSRTGDAVWQEVLLLVAEMIDQSRLAIVVDHLLNQARDPAARVSKIGEHWLLATACIGEARSIRRLVPQYDRVVEGLIALLTAIRVDFCFQSDPLGFEPRPVGDLRMALDRARRGVEILSDLVGTVPSITYRHWYMRMLSTARTPVHGVMDREWREIASAALIAVAADESTGQELIACADDANWRVRSTVVPVIAAGWPSDRTQAVLIGLTKDPNWAVRVAAVRALHEGKNETIRSILAKLATNDEEWDVRSAAVQAWATGWRNRQTRAKLLQAASIGYIFDRQSTSIDCDFSDRKTIRELSDDWRTRLAAVSVLAHWSDDSTRFVISRCLSHGNWRVRLAAAQALADAWPDDRTWKVLVDHLADQSWNVREAMVQTLATGWINERTRDALIDVAVDVSWRVRLAVASALARWADDRARLGVLELLSDANWRVRVAAVQTLVARWPDERTRDELIERTECGDGDLRSSVVEALTTWPDERTRVAVLERVEDTDWSVRKAAVQALATGWPDERTRSALLGWLVEVCTDKCGSNADGDSGHKCGDFRAAVAQALAAGWPSEGTRSVLVDRLSIERPDARKAIPQLLATAWPDPRTRQVVIERTRDESWEVRLAALQAIVAVWPDDQTRELLAATAQGDDNWRIRVAAVHATLMGWPDEKTRGLILEQHVKEIWTVRIALAEVLKTGWPLQSAASGSAAPSVGH
jgi:HEAT repeat protein